MTDAREVTDLGTMRALANLNDIIYYEVWGRRHDGFANAGVTSQGVNVMQQIEPTRMAFRFRTVVNAPDGEYVIDVASLFTFPEPLAASEDVMKAFAGQVAFPATHPFVREALRDIASRLGLKRPLLALLPPGGIELDETFIQTVAHG